MKILVIGPVRSGKSTIVNLLSNLNHDEPINKDHETKRNSTQKYDPTVGCRIIELEKFGMIVEVWDISGNVDYKSCWPSILYSGEIVDGIIFVYDPNKDGEIIKQFWHDAFIIPSGISIPDQCLILANITNSDKPAYSTKEENIFDDGKMEWDISLNKTQEILQIVNNFLHKLKTL